MDLIGVLDKLSTDGVRIEIAFDQKSIQNLAIFGAAGALVAGMLYALFKKGIA